MRCKLDENLPGELTSSLARGWARCSTVSEQSLQGTDDTSLAGVCRREQRVLITLDAGFADIRAYPPAEYSGVVVFRLAYLDKEHILRTASRSLEAFASTDPRGPALDHRGITNPNPLGARMVDRDFSKIGVRRLPEEVPACRA